MGIYTTIIHDTVKLSAILKLESLTTLWRKLPTTMVLRSLYMKATPYQEFARKTIIVSNCESDANNVYSAVFLIYCEY